MECVDSALSAAFQAGHAGSIPVARSTTAARSDTTLKRPFQGRKAGEQFKILAAIVSNSGSDGPPRACLMPEDRWRGCEPRPGCGGGPHLAPDSDGPEC